MRIARAFHGRWFLAAEHVWLFRELFAVVLEAGDEGLPPHILDKG